MPTTTEKLSIFQKLVSCSHDIFFAKYDARTFKGPTGNADSSSVLYFLLSMDNGADMTGFCGSIFENLQVFDSHRPIVYTNSLGMVWIAEIEELNHKPYQLHTLGPVFVSDYSTQHLEKELNKHNLSVVMKEAVIDFIHDIPVVSTIRFYEYGLMLHWCLTEEQITISDLMYWDTYNNLHSEHTAPLWNHHGTYLAEQKMLQSVREGNLQYRTVADRFASAGYTGQIIPHNNLRHMKNNVIIYTTLCCRAAVQGGLDIETAYTLSDQYLQSVEDADTLSSLHEVSNAMVKDYIERVHRVKSTNLSPPILMACQQISLAPQAQNIHSLAERLGYTDYYFSKLFKKETGQSVKRYILLQKMEKAKQLLLTGSLSVAEIADQLGIESQSYFTACFHNTTGMTPTEYRAMHTD